MLGRGALLATSIASSFLRFTPLPSAFLTFVAFFDDWRIAAACVHLGRLRLLQRFEYLALLLSQTLQLLTLREE